MGTHSLIGHTGIYSKLRHSKTKQRAAGLAAKRTQAELKNILTHFARIATGSDRHLMSEILIEWQSCDPWREFSLATAFHARIGHCGDLLVIKDPEQFERVCNYLDLLQRGLAPEFDERNGWVVIGHRPKKNAAG